MATSKQPTTTTVTPPKTPSTKPSRPPRARMIQNFHLVWLDESMDEINNDDCRNSIAQLRQVVNTVDTFTHVDECIDFITDINEEKIFTIVSRALSRIIVPVVQDIPQVSSIYIFGENEAGHEKWVKQWPKVHGVYTDIISICEVLKQAVLDCDHNAVSISFIKATDGTSTPNLDILDPSFMYTQILKEILLTIRFEQEHINGFLTYCQEQLTGNTKELNNVEKLRKEYRDHEPIWWYTYNCFLYSMLNRALRLMEVDLIVKMGFFIYDLHKHIVALHAEQYGTQNHSDSFIVYRGQGLSRTDFDQLKKTQGGLLAFNNFLSTSKNSDVSLTFARRTITTSDLTGVLFVVKIDPSIFTTPFANVENVSYFRGEAEILFSMHSVFRIEQIKQIDKNDRLWQVNLTLTGDNDPQLHALTERMREETTGSTGWLRLGQLMIELAQFDKAEELYNILLQQTTDELEKAYLFYQLGWVKNGQGKYPEAIEFYEQALEIEQRTLPSNHPSLAKSYNNIGNVYQNMGEYSKALSYYEQALKIDQKALPANHPSLATSYNNIGNVYQNMGEYSKALSYYEQALKIDQKTLPANHPSLATSYNNIGLVYQKMGEYSKALSYYEKDLDICQKTLPAHHPALTTSYNNIGQVYQNMNEYSKALSYFEKALGIEQKTLPATHPSLAGSYNHIGVLYQKMGKHSKALSYYVQALDIDQKTLPPNHPSFASSYSNIGGVYYFMGEYSKALSYYEQALVIQQKTLPADHPDLASFCNNISIVYFSMGDYSKALSCLERALNIWKRSLPPTHPNIKNVKMCIEIVKKKL